MNHRIWTIGHSTRTLEDFLVLLRENGIRALADVRSMPGSRRYPHFDQENLQASLEKAAVAYFHLPKLGGRRRVRPDSPNTAWRAEAFRAYADYMETDGFRSGVEQLLSLALEARTAVMCAEAVWWRCHRSLIADYLKAADWTVLHIMGPGQVKEHPFTAAASIRDGQLSYHQEATSQT